LTDAPPHPGRILIIRPSALGDVCRTVPVLASLRAAYPQARVDWLVQDTFLPAIQHHPALSAAIAFPRDGLASALRRGRPGPVLAWLGGLRRARYELVLDCQGLARSGFFAAWTRAPLRVGYGDARELGWLGLNRRVHAPASMHAADRMLALVESLGIPAARDLRLYSAGQDRRWAAATPLQRPFTVIAPTSRWSGKVWPAERHAAVARHLRGRGIGVAIVGSAGERGQMAELLALSRDDPGVVDLAGATSIGQLMALIEQAALVIASDSAALHMAVGFDRPLIGLFGPTRIERVGPYGRERDVIQHISPGERLDHKDAALGRRLMERITVEEVIGAAEERLVSPGPVQHRA
jgi:heptosyltransferase-1